MFLFKRGVINDVRTLKPQEQKELQKFVSKVRTYIDKHKEEFLEVDKQIILLEPEMNKVLEKFEETPLPENLLTKNFDGSPFYISPDSSS